LAQAKTGTGKTLAFLVPAMQNIIKQKTKDPSHISVLIISPTREVRSFDENSEKIPRKRAEISLKTHTTYKNQQNYRRFLIFKIALNLKPEFLSIAFLTSSNFH
jgi:superfamily II DNA/RNA helicase